VEVDVTLLAEEPPYSAAQLRGFGLRGLHCGCGPCLCAAALNADQGAVTDAAGRTTLPGRLARVEGNFYYLQHDHTRPFPLPDAVFDWAYAEHFIEHLSWDGAVGWLREVRRMLKPGGVLRLTTPDLDRYVRGYLLRGDGFFAEHRRRLQDMGVDTNERPAWMINQIFYGWGHQWIYDLEELRAVLASAGFDPAAVVTCAFQQGRLPELSALDRPERNDESLYVEVVRD
jgi:predicted SAM-dependent methyltransferase